MQFKNDTAMIPKVGKKVADDDEMPMIVVDVDDEWAVMMFFKM